MRTLGFSNRERARPFCSPAAFLRHAASTMGGLKCAALAALSTLSSHASSQFKSERLRLLEKRHPERLLARPAMFAPLQLPRIGTSPVYDNVRSIPVFADHLWLCMRR